MPNKLNLVLDTNVLLVSISSKSKYHWIFEGLLNDEYNISVSNEILIEYEEIISSKYNSFISKNVIRALLVLPNINQTDIYYNWNLISSDPDDNKFIDCAVSANANFIITNDKDFRILKTIDFPKVKVLSVQEFEEFKHRKE